MIEGSVLGNLNSSMERMSRYQNQLSTGKQFNLPSDDPIGVAQALSLKSVLRGIDQYKKNIGDALSWMDTSDSAMGDAVDALQSARETAVRGANDTYSQKDRDIMARDIEQLLDRLISVANTSFGGRYVFAGHRTTTEPFTPVGSPITAVNYNGDIGSIEFEVQKGINVATNISGVDIFQGATDVFQTLINLRDHLLAGNTASIGADMGALDDAMEQIQNNRSIIGARINRLEATEGRLTERSLSLMKLLSEKEDVDMAEVIMSLKMEENVYRAALSSGSMVIQPSLLDFIR